MPVDFISIGIAVVIALVIFALAYFFGIKDDTIVGNISTIQNSINTLNKSLSDQNTTIGGLTNKIGEAQAVINKSIENLAGTVKTNNIDTLKLINDLKTANDNLTKSTSGSAKTLQDNINVLQTKLNDFIVESNRTDDKQNTQLATLTKKLSDLDERESKETTALIKKLNDLDGRESEETTKLKKLIDDVIAQDQSNLETVEKRFPELKATIDEIKEESDKKIKALQADLDKNTNNDKKYSDYVDTIKDYVSNALSLPDMSDKVKKMIFGNKDMTLEMYKLDHTSAIEYVYDQYYGVMGCQWTRERQRPDKRMRFNLFEIAIPECMKKIRNGIDVEKCHDYILLVFSCFLRVAGAVELDMKTMRLVIPKEAERELPRGFNGELPKLGYPLIEANADGVFTYPYSTSKEAVRKFVDMLVLKDCSGLFTPDACKRYNESLTATIICSNPPLVATSTAQPVQQVAKVTTNIDMVLEMYKLDPTSAIEYVYDQYNGVIGCPWTRERITSKPPMHNLMETAINECIKKIKNGIDVEKCHDYIFLLFATAWRRDVTLDMKTMKLVVSKESRSERLFNAWLPKINYRPISKDADGVLWYPYSEARAASKRIVELLLLKDCSGLFQEQECKDFNETISRTNICSNIIG